MKKYCFALDLKDEEELIKKYEEYHKEVWPEIKKSITDAGIINMEIYRTGNRLFMIMETEDSYNAATKAAMDAANPKVQEWETLMSTFQKSLPWAAEGEKWIEMKKIFQL